MTQTVHVPLGDRAYDVRIGGGLIGAAGAEIAPLLRRPKLWIVTERNVAQHHLAPLQDGLRRAGIASEALILPPGESTKSWPYLTQLVEWLLAEKVERRDVVVALGGGVIGDLVGFGAAILRRGVRFVQLPTSLLAQVDSSVGGKTGVNAAAGKNLIGAFYQPRAVLADTSLLTSLPRRELLAGYAEVVKYGLLGDSGFFNWLESNGGSVLALAPDAVMRAIFESCQAKARIVEADEHEKGQRALLNLGHTFAHAFEAVAGYDGRLLHGEAVAAGIGLAFDLSVDLGHCAATDRDLCHAHLRRHGLPAGQSDLPAGHADAATLIGHMQHDKKTRNGQLHFILARAIGDSFVSGDVPVASVKSLLERGAHAG